MSTALRLQSVTTKIVEKLKKKDQGLDLEIKIGIDKNEKTVRYLIFQIALKTVAENKKLSKFHK